jgi:hypothetical protein
MFQPAIPVAKILEGIHSSQYVLPAIQREFVWKPAQIEKLFDSLMRGYPIGAFLFWKVESEAGASEVRSFSVSAPVRRNVALTAPAGGGTLAGTGGVVSWTGDKGVAYYRVELNQSDDWSNPQFKFSSSGSQAQLNGVSAGQYKMRLGAFSEVSGRWEYTQPISVNVQ